MAVCPHAREGAPQGPTLTQFQALSRQPAVPPAPGKPRLYEFEYVRHGTLCYLPFPDVFTGKVYGETAAQNGIEPFELALHNFHGVVSDPRTQPAPSPDEPPLPEDVPTLIRRSGFERRYQLLERDRRRGQPQALGKVPYPKRRGNARCAGGLAQLFIVSLSRNS